MNFKNFKLHQQILPGIKAAGYATPTPIQIKAIPEIIMGHDLIGLAQTGTGKTAAFVLPVLNRLLKAAAPSTRALILAPTRELADQIQQDISILGGKCGLRSLTLYGGVGIQPQINKLKKGVDIIVACPGRLIDHINRGHVDFSSLEMLIVDEADQLFDMGFIPDIRKILRHIPHDRQTLLFSATMRREIRQLADEILTKPVLVQVGSPAPADTVDHTHFPIQQELKTALLLKILKDTPFGAVLVFTRTKHRAKRLGEILHKAGFGATSLQGNLSQARRQAALSGFRSGKYQILVATDIAARGIDISGVSHVVNYDIPDTAEAYIHRIGRTGRAGQKGSAFNLVTREDSSTMKAIDKMFGGPVTRYRYPDFDYGIHDMPRSSPQLHHRMPGKWRRKMGR